MYYSATGTGYISTPSFAIPNTGILTIETWMKSVFNATVAQSIMGDPNTSGTVGFVFMIRNGGSNHLAYAYANGISGEYPNFANFFQGLDNQWTHIAVVCDYNNKTLKAYRNGIQFGTPIILNTPVFPSTNRVKYIGSFDSTNYKLTDGSLDEVRIYNRGLGADEVAARYNSTRGRYQ